MKDISWNLNENRALENYSAAAGRYNWAQALQQHPHTSITINLFDGVSKRSLSVPQIAEILGMALDRLNSTRGQKEIFTQENISFVAQATLAFLKKVEDTSDAPLTLTEQSLFRMLEKTLVELNAHDVARSLLIGSENSGGNDGANNENGLSSLTQNVKVIRRSGQVVPWNTAKIEIAARKAFLAQQADSEPAVQIAQAVAKRVEHTNQAFIHIETIQDWVQEELMRAGHFKIAESYILYRAERSMERKLAAASQPAPAEVDQSAMLIVKRADGSSYLWDGVDLKKRISFAKMGLNLILSDAEIESSLRRSLFSEIGEEDLKKTIILNAKTLIEEDADFAKFAGRILLTYIYEETLGWNIVKDGIEGLKDAHVRAFRPALERAVSINRMSDKLLKKYDIAKLAQAFDPSADFEFEFLGIQTLYDRYLIIDKTGKKHKRLECPQFFWMRVAMGLFLNEKPNAETTPEEWVVKLYTLYKNRLFSSSTPTLFNSGTERSQLASCFLYKVDDNIESIFLRGVSENAFLCKWAGGVGGSWTAVRGTGSVIKGTNGESQGVIPFLKIHNDQLVAINQGGKRAGAGCAYLESWHSDIEDFLELRRNTGDERRRTHDMNTANWIPDLFMKRMESRGHWTLFRSNETPDLHDLYGAAFEKRYAEYEKLAEEGKIFGRKLEAIELWKKMLSMIFETGHPWITFKDPCNIRSPQDHVGVVHSSNLCTEITLNTNAEETAVCNLGSIVLENHMNADGSINHEKLRATIRVAVRALDNVIDLTIYPAKPAEVSNQRHRPIGLGLMGLQAALYKRGVPFASPEAVEFNDEIMEAIAYYAYEASSDLAAERGAYSTFKGSKWDRGLLPQDTVDLLEQERAVPVDVKRGGKMDWSPLRAKIKKQGMRNSNVLAIAPTATISNILGSTPCVEPPFKNLFVKSNVSGEFMELNGELVRDLKKVGLWNKAMKDQLKYFDGELADIAEIPEEIKRKHMTAFHIPHEYFLDAAARRQKWIDQAQSVNLFLHTPDMKALSHLYRAAWRKGLKTTYYLRTQSASNIEKATVSVKKEIRGVMGENKEYPAGEELRAKKEYSAEEKMACSIEAMRNGGTCEACQ
jgi:ribonucleoside-diphosphate reductase alpha chain